MSWIWLDRPILALVAILVPVTFLNATLPTPAQTSERVSLAGQLLIASPTIGDTGVFGGKVIARETKSAGVTCRILIFLF